MPLTKSDIATALNDLHIPVPELTDDLLQSMLDMFVNIQEDQKETYQSAWKIQLDLIKRTAAIYTGVGAAARALAQPQLFASIMPRFIYQMGCRFDLMNFEETRGKNLIVQNGHYTLVDEDYIDFSFIDVLADHLTEDVDTVVEFGAGWGRNLALLYDKTGRKDVRYIACEQSPSGREGFETLFALESDVAHEAQAFDYYSHTVDMLEGAHHVLAFTHAAIEQIAFLPRAFVDDVLNAADKVTLVFYEPVGWQRDPELLSFVVNRQIEEMLGVPVDESHHHTYTFKCDDAHLLENAASWAMLSRYNINLLRLIQNVTDQGHVELLDQRFDVYGANPFNPYSQFVLKKV